VGDDAQCDILLWGVNAQCDVHGLNGPFRLKGSLPWRPPSWIPNGQGTHTRVPSWWRIACAFALVGAPLWQHVNFELTFWWQCLGCAPAILWQRLRTFAFACRRHLDVMLAFLQQHLRRWLVHMLVVLRWHLKRSFVSSRCLSLQPYGFAFALVRASLALS